MRSRTRSGQTGVGSMRPRWARGSGRAKAAGNGPELEAHRGPGLELEAHRIRYTSLLRFFYILINRHRCPSPPHFCTHTTPPRPIIMNFIATSWASTSSTLTYGPFLLPIHSPIRASGVQGSLFKHTTRGLAGGSTRENQRRFCARHAPVDAHACAALIPLARCMLAPLHPRRCCFSSHILHLPLPPRSAP
jgi:hypothetical protein